MDVRERALPGGAIVVHCGAAQHLADVAFGRQREIHAIELEVKVGQLLTLNRF